MTSAAVTAATLVTVSHPPEGGDPVFFGMGLYSQRFFTKTSQASTQAPAVIAETMEKA